MLVATAVIAAGLGTWQVRRNGEKKLWIAEMRARLEAPPVELAAALADPKAFAFRRVAAEGRLLRDQSVLLDHQSRGPNEGVHLVTPLEVGGRERLLLIDRGFLPWGRADKYLGHDSSLPSETARIEGVLQSLGHESLSANEPAPPARLVHWNRLHLGALERQVGRPLEPALLVRAPAEGDELLVAQLPEPASLVDHVQYAITWFAIAAIALTISARELWRARVSRQ